MKKNKQYALIVLASLLLISCDNKKHHAAAQEFYDLNYWMINAPFQQAFNQISANNEAILKDETACGHAEAVQIDAGVKEGEKLFEDAQTNIVKIIEENLSQAELEETNAYYKTTKMGHYLSTENGFAEMAALLKASPYNAELQKQMQDPLLTPEEKFELAIKYALQSMPAEEATRYEAFTKSEALKKVKSINPKIDVALQPLAQKGEEVKKLSAAVSHNCAPQNVNSSK